MPSSTPSQVAVSVEPACDSLTRRGALVRMLHTPVRVPPRSVSTPLSTRKKRCASAPQRRRSR